MCRAGLFLNFLGTNGRLLNYKRVSNTYWDCPSVSKQVQDLIGEWVSTSDFAHIHPSAGGEIYSHPLFKLGLMNVVTRQWPIMVLSKHGWLMMG